MHSTRRTTRAISHKQSILHCIDRSVVEYSDALEMMKGLNQGKTHSMITFDCNGVEGPNQDKI